jgi:xanthine dehydrogenase/oxidase
MVISDSAAKMAPYTDRDTQINAPEVTFPEALKVRPVELTLKGNAVTWHQPVSLDALLQLKQEHSDAKLVGGNTEVGIETKFKHREYRTQISILHVEELAKIDVVGADDFPVISKEADAGNGGIAIGGSATLSALLTFCEKLIESRPEHEVHSLKALHAMGQWFASTQIRNVATLAGNIATASPISDMNPMLISLNATLEIQSVEKGGGGRHKRLVPMTSFFKGYRQTDLAPHEMITRVFVPFTGVFEYVIPYKQARRRDDDISIVCAGMRVRLRPSGDSWLIDNSSFGFGGMAATTVSAPKTQQACKGLVWDASSLEKVYAALAADLPLPDNVPGGMAVFRRTLATSFFFKFYIKVTGLLQEDLDRYGKGQHKALLAAMPTQLPAAPTVEEKVQSAQESFVTDHHLRPVSHGTQVFAVEAELETELTGSTNADGKARLEEASVVGQPMMHKSALEQVCGSAMYTDDLNRGESLGNNAGACSKTGASTTYDDSSLASNVLDVAFIGSTEACATLVSIDATAALALPGVVACYTADDVPGHNEIGAIHKDELLFRKVGGMVEAVGQPVGIIVAKTRELAQKAARMVKVEYAKSKPAKASGESKAPIFTIEDAIKEDSFYGESHTIAEGDIDAALAQKGTGDEEVVVVEGQMRIGGQEHFYLETNAAYCVPGENNAMDIVSSTQNPTKTQRFVASVLGVPEHGIVSRCKRMGGGFGGKETRSAFIACAAAVAAHHTGRPTRISLDRNEDMAIVGMRHAFVGKYKAGVRKNGQLVGMDLQLYSNGGFSHDLSVPVMDRALFHSDCVYNWQGAFRAVGRVAKTGITSNTAFRGFGGPQGMLVTEAVIDHLARAINMDVQQVRERNMYVETDHTPFGQRLNDGSCGNTGGHIRRLWTEMIARADVTARQEKVAEFNKKHRWRKRGLNIMASKFGINFTAKFMNQGGALVHVYTDGTVLVSHGGTEMGQGLHTKMIQVAARCLGIRDSSKVHVAETSTDKVANSNPSAASLSTDLYGMAVLDACQQIRKRLEPLAQEMGMGTWGGKDFDFPKLANAAFFSRINLSAQGFFIIPDDRCGYEYEKQVTAEETAAAVATGGNENTPRGTPFNYFTCGVACSEVEVDVLTGDMHLVRTDILMDLGCSINPVIDIGQVEGAFVQGFGWCTMEEVVWGDSDHQWVRPGMLFTQVRSAVLYYMLCAIWHMPCSACTRQLTRTLLSKGPWHV